MVLNAVQLTKRGVGPSGMNEDGWEEILTSRVYGTMYHEYTERCVNSVNRQILLHSISILCPSIAIYQTAARLFVIGG